MAYLENETLVALPMQGGEESDELKLSHISDDDFSQNASPTHHREMTQPGNILGASRYEWDGVVDAPVA